MNTSMAGVLRGSSGLQGELVGDPSSWGASPWAAHAQWPACELGGDLPPMSFLFLVQSLVLLPFISVMVSFQQLD